METLLKRRGYLRGKLTTFKNYIVKVANSCPDTTVALEELKRLELRERLNTIRETYARYDEIQEEIDKRTTKETQFGIAKGMKTNILI